ncbi:MAG: class I SAM-dependent methyltransferase [Planctomycetota bacterium]|nr:MAG: class I SAM-dependent methyltransferase [Planctomycetota bacterium]
MRDQGHTAGRRIVEGYGPETFGQRMAEVYDAWYGTRLADRTTEAAVDVLAELAAGGTVLELGIGTGRVALPLARRGLAVRGIDASPAMVDKLREKPGGKALSVAIGNFTDVTVPGQFDLIYLVFNTLFNLTSQDEQVRCFGNVAKHLTARGVFVIEAFVPDVAELGTGSMRPVDVTADAVTLEVSRHDRVSQRVDYQYVVLRGGGVELYGVPQRYAWPSELDLMARTAGLALRHRWADWNRAPFTAESRQHVSVYARR